MYVVKLLLKKNFFWDNYNTALLELITYLYQNKTIKFNNKNIFILMKKCRFMVVDHIHQYII